MAANLTLAASGGIRNQIAAPHYSPSGPLDSTAGMYAFQYAYATGSASVVLYDGGSRVLQRCRWVLPARQPTGSGDDSQQHPTQRGRSRPQ